MGMETGYTQIMAIQSFQCENIDTIRLTQLSLLTQVIAKVNGLYYRLSLAQINRE